MSARHATISIALLVLSATLAALDGCASRPLEGCRAGVFPTIDCRPWPPADPSLTAPAPDAATHEQMQTRRFSGVSEEELLATCVGVLQDLGFQITTSEASLGLVSGRKTRPTEEAVSDLVKQIPLGMGRIFLHGLTFGAAGDSVDIEKQFSVANAFVVVLTTRPLGGAARAHDVRVTFYLEFGAVATHDAIRSPALYEEFFRLLSQALLRSQRDG